jgi:hypothetical protein
MPYTNTPPYKPNLQLKLTLKASLRQVNRGYFSHFCKILIRNKTPHFGKMILTGFAGITEFERDLTFERYFGWGK